MMKTSVYRRHSRHTVIKAFSKNRPATSDVHSNHHVSQNAVLLMEDHAHLTVGMETQARLLLLFTDSLIIAKTKSLYLKLKARVKLSEIWLASCIDHVTSRKLSAKNSFVIGWPTTNYVVTLSSSEMKEKWFRALQWHSSRARQSFIHNQLQLNIQLFNNTTVTAVMVDVNSTADSVVQSLIQNHNLPGRVPNYTLCVGHDGGEEAYPLIGHELPFCFLHHTLSSTQPSDHLTADHAHTAEHAHTEDHAHTTDHAHNPPSSPRFILKNKPASPPLKHTGSSVKHRRRKSLIGWALRRGSLSQSEDRNSPDPASNQLFGLPLASVCSDGNLPEPIMDILCVLYHEGPKTLGIFRRSANVRTCRVLKEKLNSGHRVPLLRQSVLTAASILTEFLRKLPESLLNCDLYEDWMKVMKTNDLQERCSSAKSVCVRLPGETRSLLCLVFGTLNRIHTSSDVNQMTAANLALCVSPNMLWRSSAHSPEQHNHDNQQVASLVQFLIENFHTIFGDEEKSVFDSLLSSEQDTHTHTGASFLLHSSSEDTDQDWLFSPDLTSPQPEFHPLKVSEGALNLRWSRSSGSVSSLGARELSGSRSRCLSEPVMCPESPGAQVQPHVPVLRQSSCDNSVPRSHNLRTGPFSGFSPVLATRKGPGKGRYAFWKSPQFSTRFRHLTSMSSLSSTTTTSSLSSLDSSVSLSSTEPVQSPNHNHNQARAFVFGASARPRPLTPEMPRKTWSMAFTYEELEAELKERHANQKRDPRSVDDEDGGVSENENGETESEGGEESEDESKSKSCNAQEEAELAQETQEHSLLAKCECEALPHTLALKSVSQENTHQLTLAANEIRDLKTPQSDLLTQLTPQTSRLTSVANIRLESTQTSTSANFPSEPDSGLNRMKMTLFPAVGRCVMLKQAWMKNPDAKPGELAQVNIPQTLFYKQNVPLVLRSTLTSNKDDGVEQTCTCDVCPPKSSDVQDLSDNVSISSSPSVDLPPANANQPSNKTPGTFRHTIRIRLPTNVRNSVKAYFSHANANASTNSPPTHTPSKPHNKQHNAEDSHTQPEAVVSQAVTDESFA